VFLAALVQRDRLWWASAAASDDEVGGQGESGARGRFAVDEVEERLGGCGSGGGGVLVDGGEGRVEVGGDGDVSNADQGEVGGDGEVVAVCGVEDADGELVELWLQRGLPSSTSPGTRADYATVLGTHVQPALGEARANDLTVEHVEALLDSMAERGHAASTIRLTVSLLERVLTFGQRRSIVMGNVADCQSLSGRRDLNPRPLDPQGSQTVQHRSPSFASALLSAVDRPSTFTHVH
jgi:hypothetical protein